MPTIDKALKGLKDYVKDIAYPEKPSLPPSRNAAWNRFKGLSDDGKKPPPPPSMLNKLK